MLEVAYWIGPRPGYTEDPISDRNMRLDIYRDQRPYHLPLGVRDRWVVLHIHFPGNSPHIFRDIGGHTYVSVVRPGLHIGMTLH